MKKRSFYVLSLILLFTVLSKNVLAVSGAIYHCGDYSYELWEHNPAILIVDKFTGDERTISDKLYSYDTENETIMFNERKLKGEFIPAMEVECTKVCFSVTTNDEDCLDLPLE